MNGESRPQLIRDTLKNYNTDMCVCGCLHFMCSYCHCDSLQKGLCLFACVFSHPYVLYKPFSSGV